MSASIPQPPCLYLGNLSQKVGPCVTIIEVFKTRPLSQQLALAASGCALLATLALVLLAAQSSRYTQSALLDDYGQAVVDQLASKLATELAAGDRLGVASELTSLVSQPSIALARARDVEGTDIALAGSAQDSHRQFMAVITIAGDRAGTAHISLNTQHLDSVQRQFLIGLSGLAVLLSVAVYWITQTMARQLARNISAMTAELAVVTGDLPESTNELEALRQRVADLPLDLLKSQVASASTEDHYVETAILFIHFRSLPGYVDTVDQQRLQRYVAHIHRLIYGAAGFYGGQLEASRQFGVSVYFSGKHKIGSPALCAASCAWLIQNAAPELGAMLRLSVSLGLAIGGSELGRGDGRDLYPGLYTQAAVDELQELARKPIEGIVVSDFVAEDIDLITRMGVEHSDSASLLGDMSDGQRDLLERQLRILLKALIDSGDDESDDEHQVD